MPPAEAGGFMHGFTYSGHVMTCAVGAAVLRTVRHFVTDELPGVPLRVSVVSAP